MALHETHQLDRGVYDFSASVALNHAKWIGLLRAMPPESYENTYASIYYPTEEFEGKIVPKYRARFPGYVPEPLAWYPGTGEVDPLSYALRWFGLTSNPVTWECSLDIEPGSGWIPDVVGYYIYTGTPHSLLWIEAFDEPCSLANAGNKLSVTVDLLARCSNKLTVY